MSGRASGPARKRAVIMHSRSRRELRAVLSGSLVAASALTTLVFIAVASPSGAATAQLFSSSSPGPTPDAATVPGGICFVSVVAAGGGGGMSDYGTPGGSGAVIDARVAVTPGETFGVVVGGAGASGENNGVPDGGFGGGGGGGEVGGGGGGASVVTDG